MSASSTSTQVDLGRHHNEKTKSFDKPLSSYTLKKRPWRRYVTPFEDIVARRYQGSGTLEDPYIVDWIPGDVEDPQNWPTAYKWTTIAVVSMVTLAVALSSSAYSGGVVSIIEDFGVSKELVTAGISLFVVGFAFGPLFWAPLSEVFGRRNVYIVSYTFLTIWTAASAGSKTMAQLLVFRFLSGFFGSSPLANAGGTISDVLDANQRGLGMALFAAAPFLGPSLGPITGGFIGLTSGWRWVEGFLAIFCGVLLIVIIFASTETYAPVLLRRRAQTLSDVTGNVYRFRSDAKAPLQIGLLFKTSLIRPWKFLVYEPIVIILTIYTAIIYGILYLNFSAYPIIFEINRGWNSGITGLSFLGVLVGTILSVIISIFYVNPQYIKTAKKKGGRADPEDRLPPAIWAGVLLVIGLAGFAATDGPNVHWIAPIIFGVPFGCGVIIVFLSVLGYLVDSYTIYAASVLAANSVLRSLFGAAFPLFTSQMYEALGVHWAAALPGFLALACVPFAYLFYKYGAQIRAKCRYAADAQRQMALIMAARMAQAKRDDQEAAIEGKNEMPANPNGTAKSAAEDSVSAGAPAGSALAAQPAEQFGGEGKVEGKAAEFEGPPPTSTFNGEGSHAASPSVDGTTAHSTPAVANIALGAPLTADQLGHPHQRPHAHHEWSMYEALADRDEVDLSDDERLRLEELHHKFDHVKRK